MEFLLLLDDPDLTTISLLPRKLKELEIQGCENLESIHVQEFPDTLEMLKIDNCKKLKSISTLKNRLQFLFLENCASLQEIPDLPTIKILSIVSCPLVNLQELPKSMRKLICSKEQFEIWCTNFSFLLSMSFLIDEPYFTISGPNNEGKMIFKNIYNDYKHFLNDTNSGLVIPLHSHANPYNPLVRAYNTGVIGEEIHGYLGLPTNVIRPLISKIRRSTQKIEDERDRHRGSKNTTYEGNIKLGGKTKRSTRKKRKYTKKRRKNAKK
jgi:hypothetical protein